MLTAQQAAAKEAAHRRFDSPASLKCHQKSDDVAVRRYHPSHDETPRFIPGIEGIGIAGDVLRVYIHKTHKPEVDIPDKIESLPTERVSTFGFQAHAQPSPQTALSPIPCGVSIGHHRINCGTLGCLVDIPSTRCILSNTHVLTHPDGVEPDDAIMQPGPYDAPSITERRRIAGLTDYEPLVFGADVNHIDAAIAALDDPASAIPEIMTIGRPANPPVPAFLNQVVAKHGRTTGLTFGTVVDVSFDGNIYFDSFYHRSAYFENQIAFVGNYAPFSHSGDSGSLVVDNPGSHPVGLLFAGDDTHTLANPIQTVLNRFGATIVTA